MAKGQRVRVPCCGVHGMNALGAGWLWLRNYGPVPQLWLRPSCPAGAVSGQGLSHLPAYAKRRTQPSPVPG